MQPFRSAHASADSWPEAVQACAEALGGDLPADALGFVYLTDYWAGDAGAILDALRERTGVQHWAGTVGIGVCATGAAYYDQPAMAVMVATIAPEHYRLMPQLRKGLDALTEAHGAWLDAHQPAIAFVHADPREPEAAEEIAALARQAGFVLGGLTASRGEQHPQICEQTSEGGMTGVLFAPQIQIASGLTQGCAPIGPAHRVTEAEGNVIEELDGQPAVEVFKQDIGELLARDLRRVAGYIYCAFPVAGSDTGDYVVRNLLALDPEQGWMAVAEQVEPGSSILFCRRDGPSAEADLERMLARLKARVTAPILGGLYVSCVARGPNMFPDQAAELSLIREALGEFPLAGFFANGEISNDRLYGYTGVLSLFLDAA